MQVSKLVLVSEICSHITHMQGECVRVLGRISEFDIDSSFVVLAHASFDILVDTNLIGPIDKNTSKALIQFVGEMTEADDLTNMSPMVREYLQQTRRVGMPLRSFVYLNARIVRNMDGLDVSLYENSLKAMRIFDQRRSDLEF
ncbi:hypothetical protein HK100_002543 [Physocladia obscura]|uniref:Uncharacterized protein n=1 Tax=Physocladia obscura TaxID=109957 RepID=A0AAD5SV78_9FUNG|nr:hypothetical protein HK100_002543 [Physocladia obscura]